MNELDCDITLQCEYCGELCASECIYEGRNLRPDCKSEWYEWYELDDLEDTYFTASIYGQ